MEVFFFDYHCDFDVCSLVEFRIENPVAIPLSLNSQYNFPMLSSVGRYLVIPVQFHL